MSIINFLGKLSLAKEVRNLSFKEINLLKLFMEYKIAFFGVKSWEREIIEKEIIKLDSFGIGIFENEVQDRLELAKKYEIISTFIYSKMDKDLLAQLPNLKMIAVRSTGVDNVDVQECLKRKIVVANVPTYGSKTVAEYTFALMLGITRKLVEAHQSVEEGEFSPEGLTGVDLNGKTLGVIGVGNIGQNVVKLAKAFGMKVLGVDEKLEVSVAKKIGCKMVSLEECLKNSDIVTLHVPAIAETYHLINKKNIKMMKKGSYLINTSRGPVIETESLVWALNNKILAGAALDVTEEESMVESMSVVMSNKMTRDNLQNILSFHMLRDRDDVIFTPHNAFNTKEAIGRIIATTIENIKKFIK